MHNLYTIYHIGFNEYIFPHGLEATWSYWGLLVPQTNYALYFWVLSFIVSVLWMFPWPSLNFDNWSRFHCLFNGKFLVLAYYVWHSWIFLFFAGLPHLLVIFVCFLDLEFLGSLSCLRRWSAIKGSYSMSIIARVCLFALVVVVYMCRYYAFFVHVVLIFGRVTVLSACLYLLSLSFSAGVKIYYLLRSSCLVSFSFSWAGFDG